MTNIVRNTTSRSHAILVASLVAIGFQIASPHPHLDAAELDHRTAVDFIETHCLDCHTGEDSERGLDLSNFSALMPSSLDEPAETDVWEKVLLRVSTGQMPPPDWDRPAEDEYAAAVDAMSRHLAEHAEKFPHPGRTDALRRLTRTEYQNSIRDLLNLEMDIKQILPADSSSDGFDNITVGELTPMLLDRYLTAAERISRAAIGASVQGPGGVTIRVPADQTQDQRVVGLPFGTRGGTVVRQHFPVSGEYEIQVRLMRDRDELVEGLKQPHDLDVFIDRQRRHRFTVEPPKNKGHQTVDAHLNIRLTIDAGTHDVGVGFVAKSTPEWEIKRKPFEASFNRHRHPRRSPALSELSVIGPMQNDVSNQTGAVSPATQRVIKFRPDETRSPQQAAEANFRPLLRLAYRRNIDADDLAVPMSFFNDAFEVSDEASAETRFALAMEAGLTSILVNPNFLFRSSVQPDSVSSGQPYQIDPFELATRLSYFLWSSGPDESLLDAADNGELSSTSGIEKQVIRMLRDSRSEALVSNFAQQWLYLRNLPTITPDLRKFPDFDNNLRDSFAEETRRLFADVMQNDHSVLRLIDSEYTFLNERLATHYGIPGVVGSHFRKVQLKPEWHRGGLLRHGSILMVTSYATRTSPTIRGAWILENILGTPPPPPPPNVPTIKEETAPGKTVSFREMLAKHREDATCASCHDLIDPVGFALDRYDAVGRFREFVGGTPVDARGQLPDGQKVVGTQELEQGILRRPEMFATVMVEKLTTYALGRPITHSDGPAIRDIVARASEDEYRFSALVAGIAKSAPFTMRTAQ